jgi:hypothetical protein
MRFMVEPPVAHLFSFAGRRSESAASVYRQLHNGQGRRMALSAQQHRLLTMHAVGTHKKSRPGRPALSKRMDLN